MSILGRVAVRFVGAFASVAYVTNERAQTEVRAKAAIRGSKVEGTFEFVQEKYTFNTEITGVVEGLQPDKKHGIQIHNGNSESPTDTFNPFGKKHGGPWNAERKVGDLGNIQVDNSGKGIFSISDPYIKLSGPYNVVGKIVAVHENPDDLGFGRNNLSLVDGGVGQVIACGAIENS